MPTMTYEPGDKVRIRNGAFDENSEFAWIDAVVIDEPRRPGHWYTVRDQLGRVRISFHNTMRLVERGEGS